MTGGVTARGLSLLAGLVAGLLIASGCTAEPGSGARSGPSASASPEISAATSPDSANPPQAPPRKACYRYTFGQLGRTSNDDAPVSCTGRHDAQTIHVGRLDLVVDGRRLEMDADRVRAQVARSCSRRLAEQLGGTPERRRLSRFVVVWFLPSPEQAGQGADWYRCDLVAIAGEDRLHPLPPRPRLDSVLDRDGALATYGLCGTAEPGTPGFARVICAERHSWRAIATIPLRGGRDYPGTARVRTAGDGACRDRASAQAEDPLSFEYGWEWPSRQQWQLGQHYGYCWAPG